MTPHPSCPRHLFLYHASREPRFYERRCRHPTARWTVTTVWAVVSLLLDPGARRPTRKTLKGRVPSGFFGSSLCSQPAETKQAHGGADTRENRSLRLVRYQGEPQSAAGLPTLVPGHRTDHLRLAGMYALLGQMTFGGITSPLFNSASRRSQPPVGSCLMDCQPTTRRAVAAYRASPDSVELNRERVPVISATDHDHRS
jgi:hypothetical protein